MTALTPERLHATPVLGPEKLHGERLMPVNPARHKLDGQHGIVEVELLRMRE